MKKAVKIIAVVLLFSWAVLATGLFLIARDSNNEKYEQIKEMESEYAALKEESESLPTLLTIAPVDNNTATPETTVAEVQDPLLYEDEYIKVTYRKIEKCRYMKNAIEMHLYVENKTNGTLTIQADVFSLNGYSFNDLIMSDDVLANTTGKASVVFQDFDFDVVDINNISSVGGQLRIYQESFENMYKATFNDIQIK